MDREYRFYHPLRVRYVETDAQGHVFFGHYLSYFDVGLIEYMRTIGYHYADMVASGVDMYYVEATCQYKGQAYFDDLLHVHTRIGHMGNTSFAFEFAIYRVVSASRVQDAGQRVADDKQAGNELIATGKIVAVTVDIETEQPIRVPDELRDAVDRFEGASA
jgi:acyl-CoA thioester hydrolase